MSVWVEEAKMACSGGLKIFHSLVPCTKCSCRKRKVITRHDRISSVCENCLIATNERTRNPKKPRRTHMVGSGLSVSEEAEFIKLKIEHPEAFKREINPVNTVGTPVSNR